MLIVRIFLSKKQTLILPFKSGSIMRNMSSKCLVAVCQLTATNDKNANLNVVKRLIKDAAKQNAKVVFFPEATDYIAKDKKEAVDLSESLNDFLIKEYKSVAKANKVWLSIGGFHEKFNESRNYNCHVIIDDSGEIRSIYRKVHLFDVSIPEKNVFLKESDYNVSGSQIVPPIETPAGALALGICYDLRFPEFSTLQRKIGAEILTYPSAFTNKTGEVHWEVLLRSRAIENQCYVIAAAQYGKHNESRISYGQAMIIDPWGKIVAQCPKFTEGVDRNESFAVGEIDLEYLRKIRQEMPVLEHRRNDLYNLSLIKPSKIKIADDSIYKFSDKNILGATVFYISKYSYAFTNIRCVVPGHVLIASLRPVPRLVNLSQDEIADLFQTAVLVQGIVEREYQAESSTICVQDGRFAGQTIPHVHVHVLPRKAGDFQRNDDVYTELAKHDRNDSTLPLRDSQEMAAEASKLRQYFA